MSALISEQLLGTDAEGNTIKHYQLRNARGTTATFCNLGAAWVGFQRTQDSDSLVLGCQTLAAFLQQGASLGATAGRFANRIKNGRFVLDGKTFQLEQNDGDNHLHGGFQGFAKQIFDSHIQLDDEQVPTLTFQHQSAAGQGGFPGNMEVTVTVQLHADDQVCFRYHASTDIRTIINLTNHAYFNLNGQYSGNLAEHEVRIPAAQVVATDAQLIATGELLSVAGSALDLRHWRGLEHELTTLADSELQRIGGYDHCYCFAGERQLRTLAEARSQTSNTLLRCQSDLPGVQFYSGNGLAGTAYNDNEQFHNHSAFCFEPGFWPDSPNHPQFPDCTIDRDNPYSAIIAYSFLSVD